MQIATRHILFIAALLMTIPAFAGQDSLKCTDAQGTVTLTDRPCNGGEEATVLATPAGPAPAALDRPARPYAAGVLLPRPQPNTRPVPPSRILARDVATLKAARTALQLLDGPASRLQQRIAVFP